ncbi:hypothetical protein JCM14469_43010 [Desulfatiferula olefinivorans]
MVILMLLFAIGYLSYYSLTDLYSRYEIGALARGFGWYENGNDLSMIFVAILPLTFIFIENSDNKAVKYFFIILALQFSINILLTGARNGVLGLSTAIGLFLLSSKKIKIAIKIIIIIMLANGIIYVGYKTIMTRSDLAGNLSGDESSEDRLTQWIACTKMLIKNPVFGVGPNQSRYEMRNYGGVRGLLPHNTLIQVFAETGVFGGFFFFMFAIYPLSISYKYFNKRIKKVHTSAENYYKYTSISLCSFWVCACFSNRVYMYILYVLVAILVASKELIDLQCSNEKL